MKKELLRINRLNYNYTRTRKLENVSFCILEGECIGFLGLSYSGKDLMTSLLRGELTEGDGSGAIYLGGQKVNDWEVLGKEIYYMCPDNYVIEDWTVAEYLCERAKEAGAMIYVVTGSPSGDTAKNVADKVFFVPAAVYRGTDDVVPSFQPMGNLFEQCLLILFDIIIMTIVDETPGLTFEKMSKNHRNVE